MPSLAHLLALFVLPPASFPSQNTSIIVVDSLSTLFDNTYPRKVYSRGPSSKSEATKWASGRRFAVMAELLSKLRKMAAVNDISILLTSQTITRVRPGAGAVLLPALTGTEWDAGISTRLVLFRDWPPTQIQGQAADQEKVQQIRYVGIEKVEGLVRAEDVIGAVIPFTIEKVGAFFHTIPPSEPY